MLPSLRASFNAAFTAERHAAFLDELHAAAGMRIAFRLCETPVFVPEELERHAFETTHDVLRQLVSTEAVARADAAIPRGLRVPGESAHPACVQADFAVVCAENGSLDLRLIELQGFPSLYAFQETLGHIAQRFYGYEHLRHLAPGLTRARYMDLLRRIVLGTCDPEHVVLLEIDPARQKTRPDFLITEAICGIETVDVTAVIKKDRRLLYKGHDGRIREIRRIYNRVVPDELRRRGIRLPFSFSDDLDVEWSCHPNWYFRISKHALPFLQHPTVPRARFLDADVMLPDDLEHTVLKPLFSFAGGGVLMSPTRADIEAIPADQRGGYILQERIHYAPVIATPTGPAHVELRVMVLWDDEPRPVMLLARVGKGPMMGVDYNAGHDWVGGAAALILP